MSAMTALKKGTAVRFTTGPLGLLADPNPDAYGFAEPVARAGDCGTYLGPHPTVVGWHVVEVVIPGHNGSLYAPVHRSQFEVV